MTCPARPSSPLAPHSAVPSETGTRATLERYAAAWRAGDLQAMADCYAPDFTLHYFGNNPLSGDHPGRDRARHIMAEFSSLTRRKLVGIVAIMAGHRHGAIIARETFRHGENRVELDRVLVYAVDNGRLEECWVYDRDQQLVDAIIGDAGTGETPDRLG